MRVGEGGGRAERGMDGEGGREREGRMVKREEEGKSK